VGVVSATLQGTLQALNLYRRRWDYRVIWAGLVEDRAAGIEKSFIAIHHMPFIIW